MSGFLVVAAREERSVSDNLKGLKALIFQLFRKKLCSSNFSAIFIIHRPHFRARITVLAELFSIGGFLPHQKESALLTHLPLPTFGAVFSQ
jgi:hypothetical protein